ncbi:MAG: saccharopine dehydrogenase C-terminal domain-containing protein [Calditrichia bacterium]
MSKKVVVIAGTGGIGRAAGLLLREIDHFEVDLFLGDVNAKAAADAARWIQEGSVKRGLVKPFTMPVEGTDRIFDEYLSQADIVLDCLPGNQAPRIARLAKSHNIHYANLTEYVRETEEVMDIARDAEKGFVLQTGLAPGFINVLANGLFQKFCRQNKVDKVYSVNMKVGALTQNAIPPIYYGFTWSPVGVATLYVKPATVIHDYRKTNFASLTGRSRVLLNGIEFEEDLTSGGAADLPDALAGKTRYLAYKTLRYPGHYQWVESVLRQIPYGEDRVHQLQLKMEEMVPHAEDDIVVIYASVIGRDSENVLRILEKTYFIRPVIINGKQLRAIQSTTAAGLVESARLLLEGDYRGIVRQSSIKPDDFLSGPYVSTIYR